MTAYLSTLVTAARGATAQLRPRPVARFEAPIAADPTGSIHEVEDHIAAAPRPASRAPLEPGPTDDGRPGEIHPDRDRRPDPRRRTPQAQAEDLVPVRPVLAAEHPTLRHEYHDAPALPRLVDADHVRHVTHEHETHEHETHRIEQVGVLSTALPLTPNPGVPVVEQQVIEVAPPDKSEPVSSERGVLNAPLLPPQLGEPARAVPAPAATLAATSAVPDPVVHVTIGRLEIRAGRPAPVERPGRSTGSPKILSLEEYGAQRGRAR